MPSAESLIWLVPLLPWLAAAWIGIGYVSGHNRGEAGEGATALVALTATGGALLILILIGIDSMVFGLPGEVEVAAWLESGEYRIAIQFMLDSLSLPLAMLFALISLLTLRFSINYLHREEGFQRFFAVMSLFSGAMLLLAVSGNVALAFVAWEVAGLSSYLLIAYAFDRSQATGNATRAFVTNRFGDAGFVVGIALCFAWFHGIGWGDIDQGAARIDSLLAGLVAGGFILAALAKSAQMPFAGWIAGALEGPTPSSAVFYGSIMVHAGVFLLIRLEPLLLQAPAMMVLLAILGLLTAAYGLLVGLVQTDVKSSLIFSVQTQVGLMFLALGLGFFDLAAWHMALHASFRAYQFLGAPGFMHNLPGHARPAPLWLRRRGWLYTAAMQRFWIDHLADALLVRPTRGLAIDARNFDERMVTRIIGLPDTEGTLSSLAEWEESIHAKAPTVDVSHGRGVFGRMLVRVSGWLAWFEKRLVLGGGGAGLFVMLRRLGGYLAKADHLLEQPRYLVLLIVITFVVVL